MRLTGEGKKFVFAVLLIGAAAFNTGNNLIYLILSMMLSIMAVAVIALWLNMRGLMLEITTGQQIFANISAPLVFLVENKKKFLPSFSLRLRLPDVSLKSGIVPYVKPCGQVRVETRAIFPKRGVYSLEGIALDSGFPFIFLKKTLKMPIRRNLLIFPEIKDYGPLPMEFIVGRATVRAGGSEEMLYLRQFRPGDDPKKISWKATAKADELIVRQFSDFEHDTVTIIIDNTSGDAEELFEKAVSYAAFAANELINRGYAVGLVSAETTLTAGSGTGHLYLILRELALIKQVRRKEINTADSTNGACLWVFGSRNSHLARFAGNNDMVIYAEDL